MNKYELELESRVSPLTTPLLFVLVLVFQSLVPVLVLEFYYQPSSLESESESESCLMFQLQSPITSFTTRTSSLDLLPS